jgi:High potential iron-sulfur protein
MEKRMDDAPKTPPQALSRRLLLRNVTVGGAVIFTAATGTHRMAAAQTKVAKKVVAYQDQPHDGQSCGNCLQFEPPSACKVVEGVITPTGWCQVWAKKTA